MAKEKRYWLMKSEADCYSINHLKKDKITEWSGVRNYQARNFMHRDMSAGDLVLFYHSNSKPSGVYGVARVVKKAHPDSTQFDKKSEYFDPKSSLENPRWFCVDVSFVKKLKKPVALSELKLDPKLEGMYVRKQGDRLSVQPVSKKHFEHIINLATN